MVNRGHSRVRLLRQVAILAVLSSSISVSAEDLRWSEVGVRAGYIDTTSGWFRQYEIYFVHPMRTQFTLGESWNVRSNWEISAGQLEHDDIDGIVFTAGPVLVLRRGEEPWYLEVGSRPTLISEDDFGTKEFGGPFQFTSHGGVGWTSERFEIHYRIQHMSNASIYSENDGVNLHVLELGWRF